MRLIGAFAGCVLAFLVVSSVLGHAEPERVSPGDGAVLIEPPAEVIIVMTQEMIREAGANDIDVFDGDGREITAVAAVIDNAGRRRLSVPLPSTMVPGEYTVRWKTLSAEDGDTAEGSYRFLFDPEGTPSPGSELLRESLLGPATENGGSAESPPALIQGRDGGVTWILVVAAGVGMFVLGAGGTFLLVQKRP